MLRVGLERNVKIPAAVPSSAPPLPQRNPTSIKPDNGNTPTRTLGDDNVSVLGNDLTISGQQLTISSKGALRVEAEINGDLNCVRLEVGKNARVTGTVTAEDIVVHGQVHGTIRGNRVTLENSANVEGDVHHRSLKIIEGAHFEGRSRRIPDNEAISPAGNGHLS